MKEHNYNNFITELAESLHNVSFVSRDRKTM
jgi:hypothetical protein